MTKWRQIPPKRGAAADPTSASQASLSPSIVYNCSTSQLQGLATARELDAFHRSVAPYRLTVVSHLGATPRQYRQRFARGVGQSDLEG